MDSKVTEWTASIRILSTIAHSSPQCAFICLQKSYQQEWQHLQHVVDGIAENFAPVEAAITNWFLPAPLGGDDPTPITAPLCSLLSLPVKHAGIGIPIGPESAADQHKASTTFTQVLTQSLFDAAPLNMRDHLSAMSAGRANARTAGIAKADLSLTTITDKMSHTDSHQTDQNREAGA